MLPFNGKNRVTSTFGTRTLNGQTATHNGLDIVGDDSQDVLAVCGGVVIQSIQIEDKSNRTWEWGNYVCVKTDDGFMHYYCHMASRAVKTNDVVTEGTKLGVMGNTGKSFGAHLHFEVRNASKVSINPCPILGIPNEKLVHVSNSATSPAVQNTPAQGATGKIMRVFGAAKGINVEVFTGKDVNLVCKNKDGTNVKIPDGEYKVLRFEGSAGGYEWCRISYGGRALFMPYGGVLNNRCQLI